MNSVARSSEVQWTVVGMNIPCLVNLSTITKMESEPSEVGRVSMKSIEIEFHGRSGTGSCFNRPYGLCRWGLACIQTVQDLQYFLTKSRSPGQVYSHRINSTVLF